MIQRIQSILLLLAAGASFGLFGLPFATGASAEQSPLLSDGVFNLNDHIGLLIAFAGAGALALIAILLFKNRPLQMKIALVSLLFILAGIGFSAYLLFTQASEVMSSLQLGIGAFLPILGIILIVLANRYIKKDEKLVRSMDRLR
jgi:hypothetical protein